MFTELIHKRKLRDVKLNEVSFVKHPANKKKFLFWKSGDSPMDELEELLDLIEVVKNNVDLSDEEQSAISSAIKALSEVSSDNRPGLIKAIKLLSQLVGYGYRTSEKVKKSVDKIWPSLSGSDGLLSIDKAAAGVNVIAEPDGNKWPSLINDNA